MWHACMHVGVACMHVGVTGVAVCTGTSGGGGVACEPAACVWCTWCVTCMCTCMWCGWGGVCVQAGGDHLNDGVRRLLSEAGLQDAAIKALRSHAAGDERALTAVCFAIAMILRGGEKWRESVKWAAARNALLGSITKAERVRLHALDAVAACMSACWWRMAMGRSIKSRTRCTRWRLDGS